MLMCAGLSDLSATSFARQRPNMRTTRHDRIIIVDKRASGAKLYQMAQTFADHIKRCHDIVSATKRNFFAQTLDFRQTALLDALLDEGRALRGPFSVILKDLPPIFCPCVCLYLYVSVSCLYVYVSLCLCPCACICLYSLPLPIYADLAIYNADERVQARAVQELVSVLETALSLSDSKFESDNDFFDKEQLATLVGLLEQPLSLTPSPSSACIVKYAAWSLLYAAHCISNTPATAENKMLRITFIFISLCKCR